MNKTSTLLFSAFLLFGSAFISKAQTWEVYNTKMELEARVLYDEIEILSETVRIGKKDGELFLLTQDLKPSVKIEAKEIYQYLSPWIIVKDKNGLGAYHEYGQKYLENEYDEIQTYITSLLAKKGNKYFVFERGSGQITELGELDLALLTHNGMIITKGQGEFFLPFSKFPEKPYQSIIENSGDFLLAKDETGFGLINRNGDYILEPVIDKLEHTEGNFFYGFDESQYLLIRGGDLRADIEYNSYHEITREGDLMLEYIHGKLRRVMDNDGILLDTVGMVSVEEVGEFFFNVKLRDGKTGLLGKKGWAVIPTLDLEKIFPGDENLYPAISNGKYGIVNPSGGWIIQPNFEEISKFSEGIATFRQGNQVGLITSSGAIIQSPSWERSKPFEKGTTILSSSTKQFLVDKSGVILTESGFDDLFRIEGGDFLVENAGMLGLISEDGKELLPTSFELIQKENKDFILVKKDGLSGILNQSGEIVLPIAYEQILFDWENQQILVKNKYVPVVVQEPIKSKRKKKGA